MGRFRRRRGVRTAAVTTAIVLLFLVGGAAVVVARTLSRRAAARAAARVPARTLSIVCRSPSLGGSLPAEVYLPAGYTPTGPRQPVVYFLHGLPAGPGSYTRNGFIAAALAAARQRAIVVAPQGARTANSDPEYLNWGPRQNWPKAIAHDLTACIDRRYHTISGRYGRALVGLSAGGYGAMNIGLHGLRQFGAVESWSGYFAATDPAGDHDLSFASAQDQAAAAVPSGPPLRAQLAATPAFIGFYVGRQDPHFYAPNVQFNAKLNAAGIAHTFAVYPGGHQYSLWAGQAQRWLTLALRYLGAGRRRRSAGGAAL